MADPIVEPPTMHSEDAHADCGNDMCEPASRGQPTQGSLANSLGWLPNSYYRLRDSTLVARIVAVDGRRVERRDLSRRQTQMGERVSKHCLS